MGKEFQLTSRDGIIEVGLNGEKFIFASSEMVKIVNQIVPKIAPWDMNILITGETGVGKDVMAEIIHHISRRKGQFVYFNMSVPPAEILGSELFGYVKGAFTGATTDKLGFLQVAHRGTLALDEVGSLPRELQGKMLGAAENNRHKKIYQLGNRKMDKVDVRIISMINQPPEQLIAQGKLRPDLFYRLNGFRIHIPSLRERPNDIFVLAELFLKQNSQRFGRAVELSEDAKAYLLQYNWPGNVRELENVIERAVFISNNGLLEVENLEQSLRQTKAKDTDSKEEVQSAVLPTDIVLPFPLKSFKESIEKKIISMALRKCHWNQTKTAELLGISYKALHYKIKNGRIC